MASDNINLSKFISLVKLSCLVVEFRNTVIFGNQTLNKASITAHSPLLKDQFKTDIEVAMSNHEDLG